jgi:large subunit ribosomal protein L15
MEKGLVRKKTQPVKILGFGKLDKKLIIEIDTLSKSARDAIVKAGGKVI